MSFLRPPPPDALVPASKPLSGPGQYSYCSSLSSSSSAPPSQSQLSGTYMLARTDAAHPSYFLESAFDSAVDSARETDTLDSLTHESSTPTIAYFPPSPSASSLTVNTYDSRYSADFLDRTLVDGYGHAQTLRPEEDEAEPRRLFTPEDCAIPPVLSPYRRAEPTDPPLRPSDPRSFRYLFPSWDCLSIRHDDTTPDGNMNLRVDTVALGLGGSGGHGDGPVTVQLFHLRMHDLVRRHFSLRRYCRDSGREVCFSKREYTSVSGTSSRRRRRRRQQQQQPQQPQQRRHHALQRSLSAALRRVRAPFHRPSALRASCLPPKSSHASLSAPRPYTAPSATTTARPSTSSASSASDCGSRSTKSPPPPPAPSPPPPPPPPLRPSSSLLTPTNTIKLEFGNYARVQVVRRSSKRYRFEWWGHTYSWKRTVKHDPDNKQPHTFSFHLRRDDSRQVLAYIEQEQQSRSQMDAEKRAGGWVPPCYMWFQWSVITGPKDVAEIFIATGLVSLVDDCIRREWQSTSRTRPDPAPLPSDHPQTHFGLPAAWRRGLFGLSRGQSTGRPFHFGRAMSVY
ncbi:hypothetical protein E4U54_001285 [Claviceps lovelessii]|nr:hypothetical protein E4U54_001285 [Claviceps lovelessii]